MLSIFLCNGFRWPLFFYLHQQFSPYNHFCILDTTLWILDTQWDYMLWTMYLKQQSCPASCNTNCDNLFWDLNDKYTILGYSNPPRQKRANFQLNAKRPLYLQATTAGCRYVKCKICASKKKVQSCASNDNQNCTLWVRRTQNSLQKSFIIKHR